MMMWVGSGGVGFTVDLEDEEEDSREVDVAMWRLESGNLQSETEWKNYRLIEIRRVYLKEMSMTNINEIESIRLILRDTADSSTHHADLVPDDEHDPPKPHPQQDKHLGLPPRPPSSRHTALSIPILITVPLFLVSISMPVSSLDPTEMVAGIRT